MKPEEFLTFSLKLLGKTCYQIRISWPLVEKRGQMLQLTIASTAKALEVHRDLLILLKYKDPLLCFHKVEGQANQVIIKVINTGSAISKEEVTYILLRICKSQILNSVKLVLLCPNFPMKANHIQKVTEQYNITQNFPPSAPSGYTQLEKNLAVDAVGLPEVEVQIEKIAERQRQITAKVQIPHPVERIWQVLTNYEALPDFIPNLAKSCLLEHPQGGIRLEQIGSQRLLKFNFCARVVLDLEEYFPKAINFSMVEGDFKGFSGSWSLHPYCYGDDQGTIVCYTIQVWPKLTMPVAIIEHRLSHDLRLNLLAIHQRVEQLWHSAS